MVTADELRSPEILELLKKLVLEILLEVAESSKPDDKQALILYQLTGDFREFRNYATKQIEKINEHLEKIETTLKDGNFSKNVLINLATKDDIKNMATKDDSQKLEIRVSNIEKNMATKDDIKNMATKDDIKDFVTEKYLRASLEDTVAKIGVSMKKILDERIK